MAFVSKLKDAPAKLYSGYGKGGFLTDGVLDFQVQLSGHKDLGETFQALDGMIRGAASLGARNAARRILRLAKLMVPYDTGELHDSGKVQIADHDDAVDHGSLGRKVGKGLREGEVATGPGEDIGSSLGAFQGMGMSASEIERNPVKLYNVLFEDNKAWFVHEYEQDYHQAGEPTSSHPGSRTVPDSEGRRRGTKYLERAINEVAPSYPDWVAAEIEKHLKNLKPPPEPPKPVFDTRPRLVKKVK